MKTFFTEDFNILIWSTQSAYSKGQSHEGKPICSGPFPKHEIKPNLLVTGEVYLPYYYCLVFSCFSNQMNTLSYIKKSHSVSVCSEKHNQLNNCCLKGFCSDFSANHETNKLMTEHLLYASERRVAYKLSFKKTDSSLIMYTS